MSERESGDPRPGAAAGSPAATGARAARPAASHGARTAASGLWSDEALAAIDGAALELLATVGVKAPSPAVREALLGAGCAEGDGPRVCMPPEAVHDALAACPRTFTEAARDPEKDLHVDPDPGPVHVHNSGGAAVVLDLCSGDPRPSTFADQVAATRLMHHLRHQQWVYLQRPPR